MTQVTFAGEMFGRREHGVMEFPELDLDVALFGHFERVSDRLGHLMEQRLHLLGRPEIELVLDIAHPLFVGQLALGTDADQAVVGMRMLPLDVMHVVGGH